jgi:hypothetical protein
MRVRKWSSVWLGGWALTILLLFAEEAYAQAVRGPIVPQARIDDWFRSRLVWGPVFAAIAGALVGVFHLSKLKFHSTELHVNGRCQRLFSVWLIVTAVAGGLWLLYDTLKYPFISASLDLSDAFNQVWLNWRTFVLILVSLLVFSILASLATRLAPGSRCPYALWPFGPRGK